MSERRRIVPNLFVIGAAKAASSSLHQWLAAHPDISGSRSDETRFLMDPDDPLARPRGFAKTGLDGYGAFYPAAAGAARYVLDVTPMYYYQDTARRVIPDLPGARAIFIARRPSTRLKSLYDYARHNIGVLPDGIGFAEFLAEVEKGAASPVVGAHPMMRDALDHCRYASHLRAWRDALGHDRLRLVVFEDLVQDPGAAMADLCGWLDLPAAVYDGYGFPAANESYRVRNRLVHRIVRMAKRRFPPQLRRRARTSYMSLNTQAGKEAASEADRAAMARVDAALADERDALAAMFGRDIPWPGAGAAADGTGRADAAAAGEADIRVGGA